METKWFQIYKNDNKQKNLKKKRKFNQGFGREKDENRADLCLCSIVFSFKSGRL